MRVSELAWFFVHSDPKPNTLCLTVLLTHRAYRDDTKCRNKYGESWDEYCELVPYKIIPGLI